MAYKSIYADRGNKLPSGRDNPFADHFQPGQYYVKPQPQKKKPQQQEQQQPKPKSQSIFSKVKNVGKDVAKAATAGEQKFATGIARTLPGGTNDLKAEQRASEQASKNMQLVKSNVKNKTQANKIIKANASEASTASKNTGDIYKSLPTKKQIALGAASTAADILTAGTLKAGRAGLTSAKTLTPIIKGTGKVAKTVKGIGMAAGFGTAGALNAAAAGGNKKQVAENFVAGAALPGVLHVAGRAIDEAVHAKAAQSVLDKIRAPKALIEQAKAQSLLQAANEKQSAKAAIEMPKIEQKIELINAKKADGKFTNVDKVKVKHLEQQKQDLGGQTAVPPATKAPVADTQAVPTPTEHPITQAIDKQYKGGKNGPQEAKALDYVRSNPEKTLKTYDGIIKKKFGATNVVSGDEAKYSIPGFNSTKSVAYHEPASAVAKVKYQQLLADESTKHKPVLLMAGGSGAGKTSVLKRLGINYDNYAAVVDTNSNALAGAKSRIDQAIASGRHIEVFYVHRKPVSAFKSVIERGADEGRIVPIDTHIDTHYGSHDVVHQLAKEYKDNPLVEFTVASNNHGHENVRPIELDEVPKMRYTKEEIKPILQKEVDNAHTKGKISTEEHALYHGKDTVGSRGSKLQGLEQKSSLEASGKPKTQHTAGSTRAPEKVATPANKYGIKPSKAVPKTEAPKYKNPKFEDKLTEEVAQEYSNRTSFIKDTAKGYYDLEKSFKGGTLLDKTAPREAYGSGMTRITEHGNFYREFFAKNKKAPTLKDYEAAVKAEFETGRGNVIQDKGEHDIYQLINDRLDGSKARVALGDAEPVESKSLLTAGSQPKLTDTNAIKSQVPAERGISKVGQSIQEKAVKRGLKKDFGEAAGYDKITIEDQAKKAVALTNDPLHLEQVINNEVPLPDGLRATALIKAVEEHPVLSKDAALLNRLSAAEHLSGESSRSAQELRLAAERADVTPVEAMRNLREVRAKAAEKRLKKPVTKAVSDEVKQIRVAKPKVKKEDWNSFVESLKC